MVIETTIEAMTASRPRPAASTSRTTTITATPVARSTMPSPPAVTTPFTSASAGSTVPRHCSAPTGSWVDGRPSPDDAVLHGAQLG